MPCIEALTALHELRLDVADYAHGSRAFTALSRALPCLQQLQVLRLRASDVDDDGELLYVAFQARDVLAIGRALKAWPMPLLHDVDVDDDDDERSEDELADAEEKMRLSTCWRALGLPRARSCRGENSPEHMLASARAPSSGRPRGLDRRDDARLLPRAAAKGCGVCERDALAAGCGVGRVVAGRAGAGDDCG